ncbi:MAG: amino acid adenylation domain-containing protein, partial [Desulfobacterales bacterium]|nr:amino acid adenylation domain-containing protein [Desulfobacterales bacterium]
MKKITEFIARLRGLDIELRADGDDLRVNAPRDALTPDLRDELSARKTEILSFLRRSAPSASTRAAGRSPEPAPRGAHPPLSFAQQRLWFLDQLEAGESAAYNVPIVLRMDGRLDAAVMERSLMEIIRRHAVLRTTFSIVDGLPVQIISDRPPPLTVVHARESSEPGGSAGFRSLVEKEVRRLFDLEKGPLLRTVLLRMDARRHILVVTAHHIVFDGWSRGVFVRELSILYEAFLSGADSPLPDPPIQYADFAREQRQAGGEEAMAAKLAWRREHLASAPAVLELPADRPRPPVQTFHGANEYFHLSQELTRRLERLGRDGDATLFMTLLGAFAVLLSRYSGQEDLVIGFPTANRNCRETEQLIGFFVNTLPARVDLSGEPSFRDFLSRVRETTLEAYDHQDAPFEKLVEALRPDRSLSYTPLFQVMFVFQNKPAVAPRAPGLDVKWIEVETGTAKFDLTLTLTRSGRGFAGALEYNTDLFDATTMTRMAGHFQTLLEGIADDPGRRVSELPLLTEAERRRILVEWNDTKTAERPHIPVHELFEAWATKTPDSIAVVFREERLTYRELNSRANSAARLLRASGVGPGTLVGVFMERSLEMTAGLLGILKAGGAYVPLDPDFPRDRLAFMLEDAGTPILLSQAHLEEKLPAHEARVLFLEHDPEAGEREDAPNPDSGVSADDLAYVIYTSGSTGRPKGVRITHGALANFLRAMGRRPGLTENDRLLAVTTLSFDIAALELFLPLTKGARVVLASRETVMDGRRLAEKIDVSGATVMQATPAAWRLLMASGWRGAAGLKALCGGEAVSRELVDQLMERTASAWNMYGPTETTIWSSVHRFEGKGGKTPIGFPIDNTTFYVLDARLNPVPVGVTGELHIGGAGLARDYFNRPGLTAEKFIPDPFSGEEGARLYKTGDLVRYLPDGNIEFLGRVDHQVKIRGFRIELGEIEALLAKHPAIRDVVVAAREDGSGGKRLAAYFVPRGGGAPFSSELRAFLMEKLPDYMIPATFVKMASMPMTPNRKVDRGALPEPPADRPDLE